jgi:hypothetical protein
MTGTVTVSSTGTTTTTTQTGTTTAGSGTTTTTQTTPAQPGQTVPASLLSGPPTLALRLGANQRGRAVRGSVDLSKAASGGRLEVDLLAHPASLAGAHHAGSVRVGRLVRTALAPGRVSFKVALSARARRALRMRHRLALTVRIVLAAPRAASLQISRGVVLHA